MVNKEVQEVYGQVDDPETANAPTDIDELMIQSKLRFTLN